MLTADQLVERRRWCGSTDVAAILGLSRWKTAWEVQQDKLGNLEPFDGNRATEAGNDLEPVVLTYAERRLGQLRRDVLVMADGLPIATRCDAIVNETGEPVEAKTAGIVGPIYGDWGADGTDEVPDDYLVQVQTHMLATGAAVCHIPALLGQRGFMLYHARRSEPIIEAIRDIVPRWWQRHIVDRDPVEQTKPVPLEVIKRIRRSEKSVVLADGSQSLVERLERAKQRAKRAGEYVDALQSMVLQQLGDADEGALPDGRRVTYFEQNRRGYTVEPCAFRVMRIQKGRKHGNGN